MTTQDDYKRALEKLIGKIKQKKGFYSLSVGNDKVKQAHKAGILKGLDAAEKEIEETLEALQSKIGADGWMDIETAPRDGTNILLSDPYSGVGDGYYTNMRWWFYQCGDDWYSEECNPTHWMPLPPAPRKEGE